MKVLEKVNFESYDWLDFESLPNSDGYKFELYDSSDSGIGEFILLFHSLFRKFINDLYIGQFGSEAAWGNFCIDTWDIQNDRYDYSLEGKRKSTSAYLSMLTENEIAPNYTGFCKCYKWNKFLSIILDCVFDHIATYSVMIYAPSYEFVFYFHHTKSFGIYYKELNDGIKYVLEKAKVEGLEIKYANDKRLSK